MSDQHEHYRNDSAQRQWLRMSADDGRSDDDEPCFEFRDGRRFIDGVEIISTALTKTEVQP